MFLRNGTDDIECIAVSESMITNRPSTPAENVEDDSETLSRPEIYGILRNERRQRVLRYVRRNGESCPIELSDLVEHVTAREAGISRAEISPAQRKRVYNALRQTHLPKLDEAGVIAFDPGTNRIEPADAAGKVELYLETAPRGETGRRRGTLSLSVGAVGLIGANLVGMYPFDAVSVATVSVTVLAVFAVAALWRAIDVRPDRSGTDGRFTHSDS